MSLPLEILRKLHFEMLRIRNVQLKIESLYHLDEMKTPIHLCIGQEAIPVGISAHLGKDDSVSSNHRSHGHYLAKGGSLKALIAELYCRETGCSKGRGGSMHLVDTSVGHFGSSSIVGGGIPIGTGLALAFKMKKLPRVSVVYLSDGASEQGVLYESINYAVLQNLPVVYVYENNQFSVCSPIAARQGWGNIFHHAPAESLFTAKIDGNSVEDVFSAGKTAIERARAGKGPSFIECVTYRMRGHAGAGPDTHLGYRTEAQLAEWEKKSPLVRSRTTLEALGLAKEEFAAMEETIRREIEEAFRFAQESPLPRGEDVQKFLFRE